MFTLNPIRLSSLALAAALAGASLASAGDVAVKLDAGSGFAIKDNTGSVDRLRVDEATGNVSRDGELFLHSTGTQNLFLGVNAGNIATTGPGGNTAVGYGALFSNTTGPSNSAFGSYALFFNASGDRNVAVGANAGQNLLTGSDNVYLANPGVAAESGRIRIGSDPAQTATFIAGINGANVGASALPVFVNASGQLGTGGATQPPWSAPVDGNGFALGDVGSLTARPVSAGGGGWNLNIPNTTGYGFSMGSAESPLYVAAGATRDTTGSIGFNLNPGGSNIGSMFNPGFFLSLEQNFDAGAWPQDTFAEFHWVPQTARGVATVSDATGLAEDDLVVIEEPADGAVVGYGFLHAVAGSTITVDWTYSKDPANPPANGDTLEKTSSTTVTGRSGSFAVSGGGVWVSSSSSCTGLDQTTAAATLALTAVANQTGTVADLKWIRTEGAGASVTAGNCVKQFATGATALLGSVVVLKNTTVTSAWASSSSSWRPFTSSYQLHNQRAGMVFFSNKAVYDAGIATLAIGGQNLTDTHWLGIATAWSSSGGMDIIGAIGDPVHEQNFGMHGRFWFFEPGQNDSNKRIEIGAPDDVAVTRSQRFADASGTIAVLDLTGCADDAPVLASGSTGGLKCGTPAAASSSAMLGGEMRVMGDATVGSLAARSVIVPYALEPTPPSGEESPSWDGPIAEAVAEDFPALVVYDENGQPVGVNYREIAPMLLKEMKKQRQTIRAQGQEIAALTTRLERLEARVVGAPGETKRQLHGR